MINFKIYFYTPVMQVITILSVTMEFLYTIRNAFAITDTQGRNVNQVSENICENHMICMGKDQFFCSYL